MMFWVDPTLKVWIGGLPEDLKWKELQTHMNQAGKTEWVEVFCGKGKGTGAVVYNNIDDARNAIATLNGSELNGHTIIVDPWVRAARADKPPADEQAETPPPPLGAGPEGYAAPEGYEAQQGPPVAPPSD